MVQAIPAVLAQVGSFVMANALTIASLAAAGVTAVSSINAAGDARQAAYDTAAQMDARAKQERAVAHLEMARKGRADKAFLSEQRTMLATAGFAADDPGASHLIGETVQAQTLEQMLIKAQAEDSAKQMEFEAKQTRSGGDSSYKAARSQAIAQFGGDMVSWGQRYGPGRSTSPAGGGGLTKPKPRRGTSPSVPSKARAG